MANNTHSKTKDSRLQGGIVDHLWLMFEKSMNTDLTIVVRGNHQNQQALKVFRCHKLVMGRLSKLFDGEHMSQVNLTVSDDTDPKAFLVVIRYAYTDMLVLTTVEEAIPIHKVACSCEMHQLKKDLEAFMLKTANKESVWNLLSYSNRGVNLTEWAQSCLAQETKACLQIPKFLSCSQSTLQILLSLQQLDVTELELIQAVIRWTQHNNKGRPLEPKSSKELLGLCLNHLRFLCLTPAEFSRHVAQSGLISKEDALMVLINLNTGDEAVLPPYVCKIRTPRQESGHSDPVSRLLKEKNKDTESPIAAKKIKIEQEEPTVPLAWEDEASDTNKEKLNESENS
ncbi:BTB/POZ domain-containing protein 6-like isoform X2 [Neocloeon triangulifer]|uniref:BTB/POZ domain-containing protein 6-like isoform X2 n=1 Tax=Neocloeon triangulifer TaxID=2078957 RepID=UPI00286F6AC7|nr:BTB/POZ domain-containing protein 6-like isoform X2 [Neocloeon triangulifer]